MPKKNTTSPSKSQIKWIINKLDEHDKILADILEKIKILYTDQQKFIINIIENNDEE